MVASVLEVLAGAAQALVLLGTLLMGLGWGGWTYLAAVAQAVLAFVPLLRLTRQRRLALALLVPVLSAALTAGLLVVGRALGQTGA